MINKWGVILVNHNQRKHSELILKRLDKLEPGRVEVYLLDNDCVKGEGLREFLGKLKLSVIYSQSREYLSKAALINLLMQKARMGGVDWVWWGEIEDRFEERLKETSKEAEKNGWNAIAARKQNRLSWEWTNWWRGFVGDELRIVAMEMKVWKRVGRLNLSYYRSFEDMEWLLRSVKAKTKIGFKGKIRPQIKPSLVPEDYWKGRKRIMLVSQIEKKWQMGAAIFGLVIGGISGLKLLRKHPQEAKRVWEGVREGWWLWWRNFRSPSNTS